jgi:predicted acetyltransferase
MESDKSGEWCLVRGGGRAAEPGDIPALAALWADAFPGERTVADRISQLEAPGGGLAVTWLVEEEGELRAAFKALRLGQHMWGSRLPMMGLAAVAVAPHARRRGLGSAICRRACRIGRERGDVLSVLYPFRADFYRALGWGLAGELHAYTFRPESLRPPALPAGAAAIRRAGPADAAALAACYATVAPRHNGLVDRPAPLWSRLLGSSEYLALMVAGDAEPPDAGDAAGAGAAGAPIAEPGPIGAQPAARAPATRAYLLAQIARGGKAAEDRLLHVRELVAADPVAYHALMAWLAGRGDRWGKIRYDARPDEAFPQLLADPRRPGARPTRRLWHPSARILHGPMIRVLDVPRALAVPGRWSPEAAGTTLEFEVVDPELPENRGPWSVLVTKEGPHVMAVADDAGPRLAPAASLATDAATFAQIWTGVLDPAQAVQVGGARLTGDPGAFRKALRRAPSFWLLDEF